MAKKKDKKEEGGAGAGKETLADKRRYIVDLINQATKKRAGMTHLFAKNSIKNVESYQNKLFKLSTKDTNEGNDFFAGLDTKYSEEPFYTTVDNDLFAPVDFGRGSAMNEEDRRKECLGLACEIEIKEVLDKYVDEIIVYGENNNYFCLPNFNKVDSLNFTEAESKKLKDAMMESFDAVYSMLHFDGRAEASDYESAESIVKKWMAMGKYAWYYVYDDIKNPTELLAIRQLDLTKGALSRYEMNTNSEGVVVYWKYKMFDSARQETNRGGHQKTIAEHDNKPIIIFDSQIVQIDWADTDRTSMPFSLVSDLSRSFNIMRTMIRTRISWAIVNSIFRTMHTVPVQGKGRIKGHATINETMGRYKKKFEFNDRKGTFTMNNKNNPPLNIETWIGATTSGTPTTETIGSDGPDMQDTDQIRYFEKQFHKASGLPLSRFDTDTPTYFNHSPEQISNEERQLGKRISRIQRIFAQVIEKPWYTHFILKNPIYEGDTAVRKAFMIEFQSYNIYAQSMEMERLEKGVAVIEGLRQGLSTEMPDGTTQPYWALEFLIKKFLNMSRIDLEMNKEMLEKERDNKAKLIDELKKKGLTAEEPDY